MRKLVEMQWEYKKMENKLKRGEKRTEEMEKLLKKIKEY